jgi:hypothetical protein
MRFCPFWLLGSSRMKGTLRASRVNGFRWGNLWISLVFVVSTYLALWKILESVGIMTPNFCGKITIHGKIAKCSKPPTRIQSYTWCMLMYCKWGIYIYKLWRNTRLEKWIPFIPVDQLAQKVLGKLVNIGFTQRNKWDVSGRMREIHGNISHERQGIHFQRLVFNALRYFKWRYPIYTMTDWSRACAMECPWSSMLGT